MAHVARLKGAVCLFGNEGEIVGARSHPPAARDVRVGEPEQSSDKTNKFVKLNWLAERELITCYSVHSCHFTKS